MRSSWVQHYIAAAVVALSVFAGGPGVVVAAPESPVVATDTGPVRGVDTGTMQEFLGIPYAAAPVGDLRWRPPQEHDHWDDVRDATSFGPHCPQVATAFGTPSTTEDCLFLNVFTPPKTNEGLPHLLPVMFWMHGGGFVVGKSDSYDASNLVAKDVVVVTINYRLGELGFLAHPALAAESPNDASGDYGLLDQQAALRWVQRNIRAFGGDPDNVTIFGNSSGGNSAQSQLASPLAADLFHKAIVQSGASFVQLSRAAAEAAGAAFAASVGCTDPSTAAACLRSLSVAAILAHQPAASLVPSIDGFVLPLTVRSALTSGQFNRVPVIVGSNHDEWRLFVAQTEATTGTPLTPAGYIPAIVATLGVPISIANFIATVGYPLAAYPSPSVALGAVGTDAVFACNARLEARLLSQYVPTYQYEFNDPNAPMRLFPSVSFPTGAYHGSEIQYIFPASNPALTPAQEQLSATMVGYWTQFARSGDPNSSGAPAWPPYGSSDQFQSMYPPTPATGTGFAADHKCAFLGMN